MHCPAAAEVKNGIAFSPATISALLGDRGQREAARRVDVAQPDDIQKELFFGRGLDRLVVAEAVLMNGARPHGAANRGRAGDRERQPAPAA